MSEQPEIRTETEAGPRFEITAGEELLTTHAALEGVKAIARLHARARALSISVVNARQDLQHRELLLEEANENLREALEAWSGPAIIANGTVVTLGIDQGVGPGTDVVVAGLVEP